MTKKLINKQVLQNNFFCLLSIWCVFTLMGCSIGSSDTRQLTEPKIKEEKELKYSSPSKSESKQEMSPDQEQLVALFHGLADENGLNELQQKLLAEFHIYNIPIVAFSRSNSQTSSLEQQAQEVYNTLKKQAANKGIVLMGDSQGGVLVALVTLNYGKQLNIKGIITNHSPWEGAPVASLTEQELHQFMLDPTVNGITLLLSIMGIDLKQILKANLEHFTQGPGAKDLQTNSPVIQKIKSQLAHIQVPIVAIGGEQVSIMEALLHLFGISSMANSPHFLQIGNDIAPAWNQLVGSNNHDFLIPTSSQLATHITKGANFKGISIAGYHHYASLTAGQAYTAIVQAIKEMFAIK